MADVELVIKIPKGAYKNIKEQVDKRDYPDMRIGRAIANSTPLPKGHGRLGDLDALEKEIVNGIKAGNYEEGYETFAHINNMDDCVDCIRYADTIIKADSRK